MMKKIPLIANQGILKIFKNSFLLYFKNIFRFIGIVVWIGVPASIFFVLIFYWGLPESMLYVLGKASYLAVVVALLLWNIVVIKTIQFLDEGRPFQTLTIYSEAFSLFFRYLWICALMMFRIFLWSLPFVLSGVILFKMKQWNTFSDPWNAVFLLAFLLLIPVFIVIFYYSFSFFAFLLDGKNGMDALRYSKKLIKPNFWKFSGMISLLSFLMQPVYKFILNEIDSVQSIPLLAVYLFPLISYNCVVNLLALTAGIFPIVFLFFLYKKFRTEQQFAEGKT